MKRFLCVWAFLLLLSLSPWLAQGYDEEDAHPAINKASLQLSGVDDFLRTTLGWTEGIAYQLGTWNIQKWLLEGGTREDDSFRAMNHFHDPLRDWGSAGLFSSDFYPPLASNLVWSQQESQEEVFLS